MASEAGLGGLAAAGVWQYFVQGGAAAVVSELLFAAFCLYVATQASKTEDKTVDDGVTLVPSNKSFDGTSDLSDTFETSSISEVSGWED
jgi:hypothetical protein